MNKLPEWMIKTQNIPCQDYSWLKEHCERTLQKTLSPNARTEHQAVLNLIKENGDMSIQFDNISQAVTEYKSNQISADALILKIEDACNLVGLEWKNFQGVRITDEDIYVRGESGSRTRIKILCVNEAAKLIGMRTVESAYYWTDFLQQLVDAGLSVCKIDNAVEPPAGYREVKPVIKAKWETGFTFPDGEYWKCTNCKEIIKVRAGAMNFCGHCGAQMEREK
ncbi:MAG: hypothetical protein K6E53_11180 [Lachnospiraceae bacterium]|nr:hypothetical protein [Lachnospiraceae bacterium]